MQQIDRDLEGWILNQKIEKKLISSAADSGAVAGFYSVGASQANFRLTAIQCGKLGGIYCGFLFWDCEKEIDLFVFQRWSKDWIFDCLGAVRAVSFYHGLSLPRISLGYREWAWEAHSRVNFSEQVIKIGKPILGGRFLCNYFWLASETPRLFA